MPFGFISASSNESGWNETFLNDFHIKQFDESEVLPAVA